MKEVIQKRHPSIKIRQSKKKCNLLRKIWAMSVLTLIKVFFCSNFTHHFIQISLLIYMSTLVNYKTVCVGFTKEFKKKPMYDYFHTNWTVIHQFAHLTLPSTQPQKQNRHFFVKLYVKVVCTRPLYSSDVNTNYFLANKCWLDLVTTMKW